MSPLPTNLSEIAETIGTPLEKWPGNCDGIARQVMKAFPVKGLRYARGFWTGPIAKTSVFHGHPFAQHTWLVHDDGRVVDPTRWAFTMTEPEIYIGPADHYDEAGIGLYRDSPAPMAVERKIAVTPEQAASLQHPRMLPIRDCVAFEELAWLGKRDPEDFDDPVRMLQAIIGLGHPALIPIDIKHLVLEKEKLYCASPDGEWFDMPDKPAMPKIAILSLLFDRFLDPDRWDNVAEAAEEIGYDVNEVGDALEVLRQAAESNLPIKLLKRDTASCLCQVAAMAFGNGNARQIEDYASRHSIDIKDLDAALQELGNVTGMDMGWC